VVASKHPIVRTALGTLLTKISDFEVVAETDPSELLEAAKRLPRGVFVIELGDPEPDGLRTVAALRHAAPAGSVVILSSIQNPSYIRTLLAAGVKAFLLRSANNSELYDAIRAAYRHKRYLDPRLSDSIAELVLGRNNVGSDKVKPKPLSGREAEVLRLIARGFTTGVIASRLKVSARTVQTYRERIYEKLEFRTRADLVHYALIHGILVAFESVS